MFLPRQRNIIASNRFPATKRMVCSKMIIRSNKRLKNDNSDNNIGKKINNKQDDSDSEDSMDRIFSNLKQQMLTKPSELPPTQRKRKSGFDQASMKIIKKFKDAFDSSAPGSFQDRITMGNQSGSRVVDFEKFNFGEDVVDKEKISICRKGHKSSLGKKTETKNLKLVEEHLQDRILPFVSIKQQGIFSNPIDRQNFENKNNKGIDDVNNLEDSYRHIDNLVEQYRALKEKNAPKENELGNNNDNNNGSSETEAKIYWTPAFEAVNQDSNSNRCRCVNNNNDNNVGSQTLHLFDPFIISKNKKNDPKCCHPREEKNSVPRVFDRRNVCALEDSNGNFNNHSINRGTKFLFVRNSNEKQEEEEEEEVWRKRQYGKSKNFGIPCNRNFIGNTITPPVEIQNFHTVQFGRDERLKNVISPRHNSRNPQVCYRRMVQEIFEFHP